MNTIINLPKEMIVQLPRKCKTTKEDRLAWQEKSLGFLQNKLMKVIMVDITPESK